MYDYETYMHLLAFRGSVTNGTTNTAIAGVNDNALTKSAAGNFLAPRNGQIIAAAAGGVNASRARINTPNFRQIGFPSIAPINTGITIPSPPNLALYGDSGPKPAETDEISVESTHTDAAPQIQYALMWIKFGNAPQPGGSEYRLRFTAAVTGVVGSWASGAVTFDQTLPAGKYGIIGMDVFGTNLLAARLIFPGGGWRPGVMARNAVSSIPHRFFLDAYNGLYGAFSNTALPQIEIYVEAANSAQEGYLDLVKF